MKYTLYRNHTAKRIIIYCNAKLNMNWCNKLSGNTCKLIIRIMPALPTAAQGRYKKLNTELSFPVLFYKEINLVMQKFILI